MHRSSAIPGGTTPGCTKGKQGDMGMLETQCPPGTQGNLRSLLQSSREGKREGILQSTGSKNFWAHWLGALRIACEKQKPYILWSLL